MAEITGTVLDEFDDIVGDLPIDTLEPIVEEVNIQDLNPGDYGGDRFDASGNLIKDNKIFKTKEALVAEYKEKNTEKPNESEESDEYSVDAEGNLITKDGTVFKKKGEYELDKDGNVTLKEESFINSLLEVAKAQGYKFEDDEGKPIEFEDTQDGYFQVAEYIAQHQAISYINEMLDSEPELKNLRLHLQAGGDPLEYYKNKVELKDYNKVSLKDNPLDQELTLLEKFTSINRMDEKTAKEMVDLIKSAGNLEVKSQEALGELQTWQKAKADEEALRVAETIAANKKEKEDTLKSINEIVTKGELGNIQVPTPKRKEFYEYLTRDIGQGLTQSAKDYDTLPLDKKLMFEYLLFSKLDLNELVKIQVKKEQADIIKARQANTKPIKIVNNAHFVKAGTSVPELNEVK